MHLKNENDGGTCAGGSSDKSLEEDANAGIQNDLLSGLSGYSAATGSLDIMCYSYHLASQDMTYQDFWFVCGVDTMKDLKLMTWNHSMCVLNHCHSFF